MKAKTTIDRQLFTVGFRRRFNPEGGPLTGHLDVAATNFMDGITRAMLMLEQMGVDATITFIAKGKEAA